MQKSKSKANLLKITAVSAVLAACSIILGKYLQIPIGDAIRISFENLPILLAAFYFGPISAVAVAVVADLVGCLLLGYTINPIVTLGATAIGLVAGIFAHILRRQGFLKVFFTVLPAHLIGSVLIKTFGLAKFYSMPLTELILIRLFVYLAISAAEIFIIFMLSKNRAFSSQMQKFKSRF